MRFSLRFLGNMTHPRGRNYCGWFAIQQPTLDQFSPVDEEANRRFIKQFTIEYLHAGRLGVVESKDPLEEIIDMLRRNQSIRIDESTIGAVIDDFRDEYPTSSVSFGSPK